MTSVPDDVVSVDNWDLICAGIRRRGMGLLRRFVKQKSVSVGGAVQEIPFGIARMVAVVRESLNRITGVTFQVFETRTYPVVVAQVPASRNPELAPTILLYGMADTRPLGDPEEWLSEDPLKLEMVKVDGEKRWLGRGVFNSKSGLAGMIETVKMLATWSLLPCNVVILIDFEEEVRVDSVAEVLAEQRKLFARCQAAFMPLCAEDFDIYLGAKGVAVARVTFREKRTPSHSGMECVREPSNLFAGLVDFLEVIQSHSQGLFYNEALYGDDPTKQDEDLARRFADQVSLEDLAGRLGLGVGELRDPHVERLILDHLRSHINVLSWNSQKSEGTLPTRTWVDLEYRLSPDVGLSVPDIEAEVEKDIRSSAPFSDSGVVVESVEFVAGTGRGFRGAAPNDPFVRVLQRSYGTFGVERSVSLCLWGSCPEGGEIARGLGIPFLFGGLGRGGGAHVPNEWIADGALERFKEWLVIFLHQFAQQYQVA